MIHVIMMLTCIVCFIHLYINVLCVKRWVRCGFPASSELKMLPCYGFHLSKQFFVNTVCGNNSVSFSHSL